jgi:hypothetical protein
MEIGRRERRKGISDIYFGEITKHFKDVFKMFLRCS